VSSFHVCPGSGGSYVAGDAGVEGIVCAFKRGLTMSLRVGIVMYPQCEVGLLLLTEREYMFMSLNLLMKGFRG
jgi:hypothetical protein